MDIVINFDWKNSIEIERYSDEDFKSLFEILRQHFSIYTHLHDHHQWLVTIDKTEVLDQKILDDGSEEIQKLVRLIVERANAAEQQVSCVTFER